MVTKEEIQRRVEEADVARSTKRAAVASQIGDLAQNQRTVAGQLADIERRLGELVAASGKVIDLDELARFTDVPVADLTRWLDGRKPARGRRKPTTASRQTQRDTAAAAKTPLHAVPTADTR